MDASLGSVSIRKPITTSLHAAASEVGMLATGLRQQVKHLQLCNSATHPTGGQLVSGFAQVLKYFVQDNKIYKYQRIMGQTLNHYCVPIPVYSTSICGHLRQRRLASQCLFAAAHVSRNSDDERGTLQRFRHLSGTPSALSTPALWQRLDGSHGTSTLLLHRGLDPGLILDSGDACLGRPPNTPSPARSCAGPFGSKSALHTAAGSRPTQFYQHRQRLWSPAQLQYHDRY
jgi:hypothetical protein